MNHSQLPVNKVKVEATLFSTGVDELGLTFAVGNFETSTGFHCPKDGNEAFGDLVFFSNLSSEFLFSLPVFDLKVGTIEFLRTIFGMLDDTFRMLVNKFSEIFDESVVLVEQSVHGFRKANRQIAFENDPIKAIELT